LHPASQTSASGPEPLWMWIVFHLVIFTLLALDLGLGRRREHSPSLKNSLAWVFLYVALALIFAVFIAIERGQEAALLFTTGYLIEYSLSMDNIFVFLVIFSYFAVPVRIRHYVLFWGILGALIFRGIFIGLGALIISRFEWILYLFGAFLLYTAIHLLRSKNEEVHPERNPLLRWFRKHLPITKDYHGAHFHLKIEGKRVYTPLVLVLIAIETTDIIFAVDSIPAIFTVTTDPFLVYTSNIFAILGLRSLFFVLDRIMPMFRYLRPSLSIVLAYIGIKMLISYWIHISAQISLVVVFSVLFSAVILSLIVDRLERRKGEGERVKVKGRR